MHVHGWNEDFAMDQRLIHPVRRLANRMRPRSRRALKPFTYSAMHFVVAVGVAFALTRDWRIALGVGIIEPLVQTVAYALHEAAWDRGLKSRPEA